MPNLKWSQMSRLQLGTIAECYARAEFISYDYEVYDTLVDDRGIDFIARKNSIVYEVQVKSVSNYNYTYVAASKMPSLSDDRLVCYIHFIEDLYPHVYIIPANTWRTLNEVFVYREYKDLKSAPEYGINISRKNRHFLDDYIAEKFFNDHEMANLTTQFYQNPYNEIFAIVEGVKSGVKFQRIIRNIETFGYQSKGIYELALLGFDNFSVFNSDDYGGYNYYEVLDQLGIYTDEMRLIASISTDCGSELYFDAMDESAKMLFSPMADWI